MSMMEEQFDMTVFFHNALNVFNLTRNVFSNVVSFTLGSDIVTNNSPGSLFINYRCEVMLSLITHIHSNNTHLLAHCKGTRALIMGTNKVTPMDTVITNE